MTLPTAVREYIRRLYAANCIYRGGVLPFQRNVEESSPEVCIEDAMLRIHKISYKQMKEYAQFRTNKMEELGCFGDTDTIKQLKKDEIDLNSSEPMWFDVFLWIMIAVMRFYNANKSNRIYVMLFDRGTPPAKYLKHIERYAGKIKKVPKEHLLKTKKEADKLLETSPFIPYYMHQYMNQRVFVNALIRRIAVHFIPKYYRPPDNRMFILDGPSQNRFPLLWSGGKYCECTKPEFRNHCLDKRIKHSYLLQ